MPSEPRWLEQDEIIAINRLIVEQTGEPFALLNPALLESAWAKPIYRRIYDGESDLIILATSLLFGIARNHPFEQGNKRTGFLAATAFLAINDYALIQGDSEQFAEEIIAVIEGRADESNFASRLRRVVVPLVWIEGQD